MRMLTSELMKQLLAVDDKTCLSLYMPTHRSHPENLQDPIRFRNLVKQLEASLRIKYTNGEVEEFLTPFEELGADEEFWKHTSDGLAVLSSKEVFEAIVVQMPVEELAIVADSFHTKPLRQFLQSADRYHVLGLTRKDIRFFVGNRHALQEVVLPKTIPTTITDALGVERTEKHTTVASYGGVGGESGSMHHGHGGRREETDIDTERFFRAVADSIWEHYSKPTGLALILVALTEHHSMFHEVSKNNMLLTEGVHLNPAFMTTEALAEKAWAIMEPEYQLKLAGVVDKYQQAKAGGKGLETVKQVAVAAVEGRVDTLIIEADRIIEGRVTNLVTGNVQNKDIDNPRIDDLLDDMGELVLKMGGSVVVLPKELMPSETGMAAVLRY